MTCRSCLAAAAILLLAAASLSAQQVRFRLGGVRARYADTVSGSAGVFSTRLSWDGRSSTGTLDGSFTQFTSGTWAAQAATSLFGIRLLSPHVGLGLRLDGDGGYIQGGTWSALGSAGPVAAVVAGDWIWSAGVAAGGVRRVDQESNLTLDGSLTVRRDVGRWSVQGGVAATRAGATRFADATLGVQLRAARLTLSSLAGARAGNLGGKPWYQGRATFRVLSWATLEAEAGTYPQDLSGFTDGAFLSFGVWLGGGLRTITQPRPPGVDASAPSTVAVEVAESGHQRVTFHVPGAHNVAIAGEWNEWTPAALVRVDDEHWRADLALSQGAHRFSLVIDGSRWMVPRGIATLPDDMGGTVGLLVVDR
ncbi:MAG TPA: glycogen-binding domain-containing protein [Gemmatimonadales bacterium]|nr:glycogen-binding domain-containing protein [Gemmatimonadales bacterium]